MGISVVASFLDPTEAEIAAGALRSAGFQAQAMDQNFAAMDSIARQSLGGIRVGVPDEEVEEAAAFLGAIIRDRPKPPVQAKAGASWHVLALVIGALVLLSWAMIRPEAWWQQALLVAGSLAPFIGWMIVMAAKSRGRSSQWTGIMLVVAGLLLLTAAFIGVGLLFAWLPAAIYPDARG